MDGRPQKQNSAEIKASIFLTFLRLFVVPLPGFLMTSLTSEVAGSSPTRTAVELLSKLFTLTWCSGQLSLPSLRGR